MIAKSPRVVMQEGTKSHKAGFLSHYGRLLAVLVVLMGLISGCISLPPAPELTGLGEPVFLLDGKLGIRSSAGDPQAPGDRTSVSLNFRWREHTRGFDIQFWGPLGQGRSHLVGTPDKVELTTPDGNTHQDTNLESLMWRWLGWSLPVGVLRYWVRGIPAPAIEVHNLKRQENGEILGFQQLGWTLEFPRYTEADGKRVPGRVKAKHGDTRLILVNRAWHFEPTEG